MIYLGKSYQELITLPTIEERFEYLKIGGQIGYDTFGFDRYLNQQFYASVPWKRFRNEIIVRDDGNELALDGYQMTRGIIIHHLNPITKEDILENSKCLMDPDNVVCVSLALHNAIHYGDSKILDQFKTIERTPFDTCPWKKGK